MQPNEQQTVSAIFDTAVATAVRAPSIHNTQPWRWRLDGETIRLSADRDRQLPATDPSQRALLLSCGAALHHMRVALARAGLAATVTYFPDLSDPDHLADLTVTPAAPPADELDLAAAIAHRRSDRRRYGPRPAPARHLRSVARAAVPYGAAARLVPPDLRELLARVSHTAADRHRHDAAYQRELSAWSGRHGTTDGVPAANTPPMHDDDIALRAFAAPELADPQTADQSDWLALCTPADDRLSRIKAGEAASAVLLTATALGLSTCLQTEPLELPELRAEVRSEVLFDCAFAHALVRVGTVPAEAESLPVTPRRAPADVVESGERSESAVRI
ncbi:Acg family FMN-binding oxidoreductase [Nocardia sp. alder85J]|uniref:Acg family FMN-binding oxidoreductase n=1 Tax=Nocardia sp. alder85J TaxID=2862949 RepID=UPI001CD646F8|nr:hypothetical protein [Nocardia sp. alder85J]MCX4098229.1 hypothetical protein [Nocardia sp. alder85J]